MTFSNKNSPGIHAMLIITAVICTAVLWASINSLIDAGQDKALSTEKTTEAPPAPAVRSSKLQPVDYNTFINDQYGDPIVEKDVNIEPEMMVSEKVDPGDRGFRLDIRRKQMELLRDDPAPVEENEEASPLSLSESDIEALKTSGNLIW